MIYECDQCCTALPAGVFACPRCGEVFDEAVPADAVLPRRGFRAVSPQSAAPSPSLALGDFMQVDETVRTLSSQVVTLTNRLTVLEMKMQEDKRRFGDHVREALRDIQQNGW